MTDDLSALLEMIAQHQLGDKVLCETIITYHKKDRPRHPQSLIMHLENFHAGSDKADSTYPIPWKYSAIKSCFLSKSRKELSLYNHWAVRIKQLLVDYCKGNNELPTHGIIPKCARPSATSFTVPRLGLEYSWTIGTGSHHVITMDADTLGPVSI